MRQAEVGWPAPASSPRRRRLPVGPVEDMRARQEVDSGIGRPPPVGGGRASEGPEEEEEGKRPSSARKFRLGADQVGPILILVLLIGSQVGGALRAPVRSLEEGSKVVDLLSLLPRQPQDDIPVINPRGELIDDCEDRSSPIKRAPFGRNRCLTTTTTAGRETIFSPIRV